VAGVETRWVGTSNYSALLESNDFWTSLGRGVIYAVYTVLIQVVVGTVVALALNRVRAFSNLLRAVIFLPYMIPTVAVAIVASTFLNNEVGLVNYFLLQMGLNDTINFFGPGLAMHAVAWVSGWKWSIFVVILLLARLQSIDEELYEMAKVNGASSFRQFMDVTYPNIKSALFLIVLLRSIWMFNKFDMIWLLTSGGPLNETTTMVIYAYNLAFKEFQFGMASALTTIMFLILLVFGLLYFALFSPEKEVEVEQ